MSVRDIGKVLGVSNVSVWKWVNSFAGEVKKEDEVRTGFYSNDLFS
jgi:transposase-like protein